MFSTCIFCNAPLGQNEAVEAFPVGSRLAFDAARGRLWVVCRACERWNLSPLDERWEAIEEAERLYRDTRKRVSTENIGLAKLRDGTTLVRIGEPQRPEFAAWRYGDQFGRRRTRAMLMAGGGVALVGGVYVGGAVAGGAMGGFTWMFMQFGQAIIHGRGESVVARIRTDDRGLIQVRRRHLAESAFTRDADGALALDLRYKNGQARFTGPEAARIAAIVVPKVNRFGGSRRTVADAVAHIEHVGSSHGFLEHVADASRSLMRTMVDGVPPRKVKARRSEFTKYGLFSLPAPYRLALEMALHEEAERRALEGELAELERAWRDAEEIAAIADNMFVPAAVEEQFRKLKGEA